MTIAIGILTSTSIDALRKAIMSMKDIGARMTLEVQENESNMLISVVDQSLCSGMYAPIPMRKFEGHAKIKLDSAALNKMATKLKALCSSAVKFQIIHGDSIRLFDSINTQNLLFALQTSAPRTSAATPGTKTPNNKTIKSRTKFTVKPLERDGYHAVPFISADILNTLVNLSIVSAVMKIVLYSNGKLMFSNDGGEYGTVVFEKELVGFGDKDEAKTAAVQIVCELSCIIKFTKQLVNPLVNSSTDQCMLFFPKKADRPFGIRFLLKPDIYQYFLMYPYNKSQPEHTISPGSTQNPIEHPSEPAVLLHMATIASLSSSSSSSPTTTTNTTTKPVLKSQIKKEG